MREFKLIIYSTILTTAIAVMGAVLISQIMGTSIENFLNYSSNNTLTKKVY